MSKYGQLWIPEKLSQITHPSAAGLLGVQFMRYPLAHTIIHLASQHHAITTALAPINEIAPALA